RPGRVRNSTARAGPEVSQGAEQSNALAQSQQADAHSTQTQSQDGQSNTANQTADPNHSDATSGTVSITGGGDVEVEASELKSSAEAGVTIGQLAFQSNDGSQDQAAGEDSNQNPQTQHDQNHP